MKNRILKSSICICLVLYCTTASSETKQNNSVDSTNKETNLVNDDSDILLYMPAITGGKSFIYQQDQEPNGLAEYIDSLPSVQFDPNHVAANGKTWDENQNENSGTSLTNTDLTNQLVHNILAAACALAKRENFIKPYGGSPDEPAQPYGLAYSYGQRNYTIRSLPPAGTCRYYKVFGTDCSGLLLNAIGSAGLPYNDACANTIRTHSYLQSLIDRSTVYKNKVNATELGQLSLGELKEGDIIYWFDNSSRSRAFHIGIVGIDAVNTVVVQSNGNPNSGCDLNFGKNRGPGIIKLTQLMGWSGFDNGYGVTRLEPVAECNDTTVSGSDAPETHQYDLHVASGTFNFSYDTYYVKDRIVVSYEGRTLFDTGCVGDYGTVSLTYSGNSSVVTVSVSPDCAGETGTAWEYTVGCPGSSLSGKADKKTSHEDGINLEKARLNQTQRERAQ